MNAKNSVFAICVEAIIYLLLRNLNDCAFKHLRYQRLLKIQTRYFYAKYEHSFSKIASSVLSYKFCKLKNSSQHEVNKVPAETVESLSLSLLFNLFT